MSDRESYERKKGNLGIFSARSPLKCSKCRVRKPQPKHLCPFDNEDGIICDCCIRCENICIDDQMDLIKCSGSHSKK